MTTTTKQNATAHISATDALALVANSHEQVVKSDNLSRSLLTFAMFDALIDGVDVTLGEQEIMSMPHLVENWLRNNNRTALTEALIHRWIGVLHVPASIEHEVSDGAKVKTIKAPNPQYNRSALNNIKEALREYAIPVAFVLYTAARDGAVKSNQPLVKLTSRGNSLMIHAQLLPEAFAKLFGVSGEVADACKRAMKGETPYITLGKQVVNCSINSLAKLCKSEACVKDLYQSQRAPSHAKKVKPATPDYSDTSGVSSYTFGTPATGEDTTKKQALAAADALENFLCAHTPEELRKDARLIERLQDIYASIMPLVSEVDSTSAADAA